MISKDFLIVGHGLAGALLAHFLRRAGKTVLVIDEDAEHTSSKVAAGIINPITGRFFVKSWRIDDLLPVAKSTYQELEKELGVRLYREIPVIRALFSAGEENDWMARTGDPAYRRYLTSHPAPGIYPQITEPAFSYGGILESAQLDVPLLLRTLRRQLADTTSILTETFDFSALNLLPDGITYKDYTASKILFCEGAKAKESPFFSYLPIQGNKGETLTVKLDSLPPDQILKHRVFIVPMPDGTAWIGSTSDNHYTSDLPSEKGLEYLDGHLRNLAKVPYSIQQHRAAIRPTVKDRRPLLGLHPLYNQIGIFNGLGTKGASLGPFFAREMTRFLLHNAPLDPEVDIRRFPLRP